VSYSTLIHLQPSWWKLLVPLKSEICGSHCVVVKDSSFLGCGAMSLEKCLPTFRSIVASTNCWRWTLVDPLKCRKLSTNNSMSDSRGLQSSSTEMLVSIYTNNRRYKPDDRNINTNMYLQVWEPQTSIAWEFYVTLDDTHGRTLKYQS